MPKVSKKKASGADVAKPIPKLLVLKHGQKRVMVNRHKSYNVMLDNACKHFPTIPRNAMTFQTNQLDICEGQLVDITAETWDNVIESLTSVEVTRAELPLSIALPPSGSSNAGVISSRSNNDKVRLHLVLTSGDVLPVTIELSARVQELADIAARKSGGESTNYRTMWRGSRLDHDSSIRSCNILNGDSIYFIVAQVGGKPVIYLYSPSNIDVSVKLSLSPEWSFSAIYPVVTLKQEHGQHVEWNVRTHQDGSLTERNSGLDVSYLFWEAKTNSDAFPHSPASELQSVDVFSPTSSTLGDMDSIIISVDKVTVYLDKSLKALGLHTEARTSFITYWLPSILKHEYIALRFVPQPAYERAAPLSLSPQPDIVTRVFMLFRGIRKEHLADWPNARMQAEKDVAWWADVVGVDLARASDTALFRVLEWGGMEVHV
ncbi:uncharacterized protein F5147DRAFT_638220 [Suillus discolor]|uniref:Ubiquitin-like domain-containing protein n=1 Tax=Suillus discolor TaxID=1912936 RepID=A0A9P7F2I0_9AGAM|nr:uncharacterized protein F5147DRAFT_638220 [Suillus discolor]KAG2104640.1 hypothetical protein F5147DRAFT_638220 [Suillus discolor]